MSHRQRPERSVRASRRLGPAVRLAAMFLLAAVNLTGCAGGRSTGEGEKTAPTWPRLAPPASLDLDRKLSAGFLIVDGVYNSELVAPLDILHHTPFHTDPRPGIGVFTVSSDGETVTSFEGLRIVPDHSFASAPPIDILVVPSAEGSMTVDLENEEMMEWVRERGADASFVVSLCDGAFVLAAAGLLDGRAATTFPSDQDRFAEMFPEIELMREPGFVHDGNAITSHGGAKSYDPAIYLVDLLYGEKAAKGVARGLVIDWPPAAPQETGLVVE